MKIVLVVQLNKIETFKFQSTQIRRQILKEYKYKPLQKLTKLLRPVKDGFSCTHVAFNKLNVVEIVAL